MKDRDFLEMAFNGNQSAIDLALLLARVSHVWDDLIDRDKPVSNEQINQAFYAMLITLPSNQFFRDHADSLLPLMAVGAMNYEIANQYEAEGGKESLALAHVLRYSIADVLTAIALIIGGPDWVRQIGPEMRRRCQKDTLEDYLNEMEARNV
jgi:hypothetical protein